VRRGSGSAAMYRMGWHQRVLAISTGCVLAITSSALSSAEIAAIMNKDYHGYNPDDPNSTVKGVTIRQTLEWKIYCHMPCFGGQPDCRVSAMMFNSKMMVKRTSGKIAWDFGKPVGWYFNQTLVDTKYGKCSFAWDGGTQGKFNMGCGFNPGIMGCLPETNRSPFYDLDPATGYTQKVTGASKVVAGIACESKPQSAWPTTWGHGPDCFWKGAAYYPPSGLILDNTKQMLDWRTKHQDYRDKLRDNLETWNEIVIDGEQLLDALKQNAAEAIPAMVYTSASGRAMAMDVAQKMAKEYNLAQPIPLVRVNLDAVVTSGGNPFEADQGDATIIM